MENKSKTVEEMKPKVDFEYIRSILSNLNLLNWIRRFGADGLQEKEHPLKEKLKTNGESLFFMDDASVKGLITHCKYKGKIHGIYSIEQIRDIIRALGFKDSKLIIAEDKNYPCFIEYIDKTGISNTVILAPRVEE